MIVDTSFSVPKEDHFVLIVYTSVRSGGFLSNWSKKTTHHVFTDRDEWVRAIEQSKKHDIVFFEAKGINKQ